MSFASDYQGAKAVSVDCNFQKATGKQALLNAINGLTALGGTFTQAGIRQAGILLQGSVAEQKNIVLLSDGEPTCSYAIKNINSNLNPNYFVESDSRWYTRDDLAESVYNYSATAGDGTSMTTGLVVFFLHTTTTMVTALSPSPGLSGAAVSPFIRWAFLPELQGKTY